MTSRVKLTRERELSVYSFIKHVKDHIVFGAPLFWARPAVPRVSSDGATERHNIPFCRRIPIGINSPIKVRSSD